MMPEEQKHKQKRWWRRGRKRRAHLMVNVSNNKRKKTQLFVWRRVLAFGCSDLNKQLALATQKTLPQRRYTASPVDRSMLDDCGSGPHGKELSPENKWRKYSQCKAGTVSQKQEKGAGKFIWKFKLISWSYLGSAGVGASTVSRVFCMNITTVVRSWMRRASWRMRRGERLVPLSLASTNKVLNI